MLTAAFVEIRPMYRGARRLCLTGFGLEQELRRLLITGDLQNQKKAADGAVSIADKPSSL